MNHYIGQLLDDRYEILEVIGTGGMAVVYKALDHRLNRLVAIKILKDEFSGDDEFRRRFRAEGEAVAMLSHPNIVQVYDVSSSDTANYLVMELINGISLKQYMEVKGVLNWKETLHFAMQIAKGLEHAHSRGIVHRDIKPHNVMVLKDGSVKVMDFGIARVMSKSNTLTKEALGSVHYISPEQAKGGYTDSRSDIYSLSVVMYEMMTGRPPFDGESPVAVAIQHINGGAPKPSSLNPNIPVGMEQIILKGMALEPKDRYASATEMIQDMEEFRKNPAIDFRYQASAPAEHPIAIRGIPQTYPKTTAEKVAASRTNQPRPATGRIPQPQQAPKRPQQADQGTRRQTVSQNTDAMRRAAMQRKKEEQRKREERNRIATIAVIVCSVVAIIAIGAFLIAVFNGALLNKDKDLVEVPYLIGTEYTDDLITKYSDFTIRFQPQQYDSTYQKGQIMYQEPAGGSRVTKGTEIVITVSLGEEPTVKIMEDLTDVNQAEAESFLTGQGFRILVRQEASDAVEAGKVIRTDPAKGAELADGQTVSIWVSTGPETVTMPNVVDMTREAAWKLLGEIQNINVVEQSEASAYVEKGNVTRTDPKVGTQLVPGQNVVVYVSSGPATAVMPSVVGLYSQTAQKQLADLGFTNVRTETVKSDRPKGEVVYQSVQKDTVLKLEDEIVLRLSDESGTQPTETQPPTETTEETEKTLTVRFTVPNKEEPYLLTILQDGAVIVEDEKIPAGCTDYSLTLTGSGTKEYDLYINGEKYVTQRVNFDG
ncbi:MAG: Stk1 family PASTA domain-containing Ser/Thr kinase [Clostridiales bacterium]|nr:Stk1 family PASTA domain-containing Ser/Thr kinase [Clostridiales bacterium]MDY6067617.1 Stk1 family PASTA domain-containing Ser/Thr kinase [Candidatus Faecousia sp.]